MNKSKKDALASVAQLVGHHPTKRKVAGSIPGQVTGLDCGFGPHLGHVQEATNQCFSLKTMFLSLFLPPFFSLK